jgi:nucleotide-binding universal stress UspA family protein
MFKRILVAVDGSEASNAGLRSAIALAAELRSTLVVLHVVDVRLPDPSVEAYVVRSYVDDFESALMAAGQKLLDGSVAQATSHGVDVEPMLMRWCSGPVADAILQRARASRAELLVLGTHGRRGLRRIVVGSDAEAVVRASPVPVLLVRAEAAPARVPAPPRRPKAKMRSTALTQRI